MAKRAKKADQETLNFVRTLNGLAPQTSYDSERLAEFGVGRVIEVTLRQDRSPQHHRLYWGLLNVLVSNSEGKYLRSADLHEALKVALGVTRKIKLLTPSPHAIVATRIKKRLAQCLMWIGGLLANIPLASKITDAITDSVADLAELELDCESITLPGSTGFWAMDQSEFGRYFEAACNQLRMAGYSVDEAIEAFKEQTAARRQLKEGGHVPYLPERDAHVPEPNSNTEPTPRQIGRDQPTDFDRPFQVGGGPAESPF